MAGSSEQRRWEITRGAFVGELKKEVALAAPMVASTVFNYLMQVASVIIVGHLGQIPLSSAAIATSLTNVTGFSLLSGMAGGLETLCGQAYGARQYHKLGVYTYSGIISLSLICPPVCVLWIFFDKLLPLVGQDPTISRHARNFSICLIPALFGSATLKAITRFLQTQSLIRPMLYSSFCVLCFHVLVCWLLVFKSGLGYLGAAVATSLSIWLTVAILGFYIKFSLACKRSRASFSMEAFENIGKFFKLGIASAIMICLKWWSMELLTLLSGLLPNPKLETSVLSICLTISTIHFTIPYGFGAAASTRVSNELGAKNPQAAKVAVVAAFFLAITEAVIVGAILLSCRSVIGYAYSNDKQVVKYIAAMDPLICASIIMDSLQGVLSGVARGGGWQLLGAYINLGAYYLVGLPVAAILAFIAHLRGKGLWIGFIAGSVVQTALLILITALTDWNKKAVEAEKRVTKR
ncbi:hypothetical protein SLA2020_037630 [Shorea laevis]